MTGDELTGAHEQISSKPAGATNKLSASQKASGALYNVTVATEAAAAAAGRRSRSTAREYDALMMASWWPTYTVGQDPTWVQVGQRRSTTIKTPSTYDLLWVGAPVEEIRVIYNTGSSDGRPTTVA